MIQGQELQSLWFLFTLAGRYYTENATVALKNGEKQYGNFSLLKFSFHTLHNPTFLHSFKNDGLAISQILVYFLWEKCRVFFIYV